MCAFVCACKLPCSIGLNRSQMSLHLVSVGFLSPCTIRGHHFTRTEPCQVYKDSVTLQRLFTANLARIVAEKSISSPKLILTDESLDQELSNTAVSECVW
jgi:hypothetical protein